jgi:hypothetical protein
MRGQTGVTPSKNFYACNAKTPYRAKTCRWSTTCRRIMFPDSRPAQASVEPAFLRNQAALGFFFQPARELR